MFLWEITNCYLRLILNVLCNSTLPWLYMIGAGYTVKDILDSDRDKVWKF